MRILVFGETGQLARAIARTAPGSARVTTVSRETADLAAPDAVTQTIASSDADLIINAAAYTAVDKAEDEPDLAFAINAQAPHAMAQACAARDIPLIHISTDYVFDGAKPSPYTEDDQQNPSNVYGKSKLAGEQAVINAGGDALILRTSWVYSHEGRNFLLTMLRLGANDQELGIVSDQIGAPTYAEDIARTIHAIAPQFAAAPQNFAGVYHFTNSGETSWAGFARAIFVQARDWREIRATVKDIPSKDYPVKAVRPLNSRLDCSKISRVFDLRPRPWREALEEALNAVKRTEGETRQP